MDNIIYWKGVNKTKFFFDRTVNCDNSCQKKFLFSMVIAMYNSQDYIREALDSIINQTIGFEDNIQIIIVDDGSTDNSFGICVEYAKAYPDNILLIKKENGGVSSARNVGMHFATGKYINFIDSDDKWALDVCEKVSKFYDKYANQVDVVTVKNELFGNLKGGSWFNKKFEKGTRVINLWKEPKVYLNSTNSTFFHSRIKNQLFFDESINISEDLKVVNSVLMNKYALGVIADTFYYYRIRNEESGSLAASARKKMDWYFPYLEKVYFWLYRRSMKQCGFFLPYLQHTLMRDLYNRFNNNTDCINIVGDRMLEYNELLRQAVSVIDDEVITKSDYLNTDYQVFLLSIKYGKPNVSHDDSGRVVFEWEGTNTKVVKSLFICYERVDVNKDTIKLEGYFVLNNYGQSVDNLELNMSLGGKQFDVSLINGTTRDCLAYADINVYYRKYFIATLPINNLNGEGIKVNVETDDGVLPYIIEGYGKWFPINKNGLGEYYYKNKVLITYENGNIHLLKSTKYKALKLELKRLKLLKKVSKTDISAKRAYKYRLVYDIYNALFPLHRPIWIISDRYLKAGDNGEAFYSFVKNRIDVKSFYAIAGDKPDYKRLKHDGFNVLDIYSRKYKFYFLIANAIVSAHFDYLELHPCEEKYIMDIVAEKKHVFLQHGITKDNVSQFYSRKEQNIDMFVTAASKEYESILNTPDYFCDQDVVKLTGFPRYDKLIDKHNKQILFMPTWRKCFYLPNNKKMIGYEQTYYFTFWKELFNNKRLQTAVADYGYTLCFFPHFNMEAYADDFAKYPNVVILDKNDRNYNKMFSNSAIMVTDYSSTAFDFAYLRKPVLYCQGDKDEFFAGHTYTKGYYDYEKDGFGKVVYDADAAADELIKLIENDAKLEQKYRERIDGFFPFNDKNNCKRVYNEIKKLK